MKYLHAMIRIQDIDESLRFWCEGMGLAEIRRKDSEKGRFTLIFLAAPDDVAKAGPLDADKSLPAGLPCIELTYNWEPEAYGNARNFGHFAYRVQDVYALCARLQAMGYTIARPPRDGHMAFVISPETISVELLQEGEHLAPEEPWASMENTGSW